MVDTTSEIQGPLKSALPSTSRWLEFYPCTDTNTSTDQLLFMPLFGVWGKSITLNSSYSIKGKTLLDACLDL